MIKYEKCRCRICNAVGSGDIAGDTGDVHHKSFILESDGLSFVCSSCETEVAEVRTDYMIQDEEAVDVMFYELANTWNQND